MTTRRLIASLTASGAALALAATVAVRSFPLEAQGQRPAAAAAQQTRGGDPIQIVKGAEHLLHAALPEYPHRAIEQRVEGDVLLDLAIDDRGEVSDARVLSGPDELRKAALESVLQWHYSPDAFARSRRRPPCGSTCPPRSHARSPASARSPTPSREGKNSTWK